MSNYGKSYIHKKIYNEVEKHLNEARVNPVYITIVGSRGFGRYTENSDYDIKVVYVSELSDLLGLHSQHDELPRVNTVVKVDENEKINLDIEFMDLKKFCKLISVSNYTAYEWLLGEPLLREVNSNVSPALAEYMDKEKKTINTLIEVTANNLKPIAIMYSIKSLVCNLLVDIKGDYLAKYRSEIQVLLRLINIISYYREYGQFTFCRAFIQLYNYGICEANIPSFICPDINGFVETEEFDTVVFRDAVSKLYGYTVGDEEIPVREDTDKLVMFVKNNFLTYLEYLIKITPPSHRPNKCSNLSVNRFYLNYLGELFNILHKLK